MGPAGRDPRHQAGHVSLARANVAGPGFSLSGPAPRSVKWAPRCLLALFPGAMLPTHLWPVGLSLLANLATLCWMADGGRPPEWMLAREQDAGGEEGVD